MVHGSRRSELNKMKNYEALVKDLLTQINWFITEELFTKGLNTLLIEERHKQDIIKFTLKCKPQNLAWV